ncbi:SymE family type I addiction module toxin [Chitinophaga sp. NPDC101104]|uniref:SymE family type I addiction module toxin n=1 Tax=Chitinophaga sp. NPDC101104 TaxID=3390561 RepID=UPI003D0175CE
MKLVEIPTKRRLTVTRKPSEKIVPLINVSGKWLEKAGFNVGDIVELLVTQGKIIIRRTANKWVEEVTTIKYMVNEKGERVD